MKRVLSLIIVAVMVLTLCFSASAQGGQQQILSEMSDEELLAFLEEYDVDIPAVFMSEDECLRFVRRTMKKLEANQNAAFHYGDTFLYKFAESIRMALMEYYGSNAISTLPRSLESVDSLLYSVALGSWVSTYGSYNCYAYATGYCNDHGINPGQIDHEINGDGSAFAGIMYRDIEDMAGYVAQDLDALGYDNISYGTTLLLPQGQTMGHRKIICLRRQSNESGDFHFMVLRDDGYWYHKPGGSTPLKFLCAPEDIAWVQEGLFSTGYFRDMDITYASEVYYFYYTTPCGIDSYICLGNDTHIGRCTVCGENIGDVASCTYGYKYSYNDTHRLTCSVCGGTSGEVTSCVYVNNVCRFCGHNKVTGSIIQSLGKVEA